MRRVLVTGGAGYIGSQLLLHLQRANIFPLVVDNLSRGKRENVLWGDFYQLDIADVDRVSNLIRENQIDTVLHFAAFIVVAESVREPFLYFENNFQKTAAFLRSAISCGVRKFVFSSTAAVYGNGRPAPLSEDQPIAPLNPYGCSKAAVEMLLQSLCTAYPHFRYVALRYFNVAGADKELRLGQNYTQPTHLITRALKTALGVFPFLEIFGTDYPTPDGTAIRDYIDIDDLCQAHLCALDYLDAGSPSSIFNLGYGFGFSVREVVRTVEEVIGRKLPVVESGRRPGDPAILIADSSKAQKLLNWKPVNNDLKKIISSAWEWEKKLLKGS